MCSYTSHIHVCACGREDTVLISEKLCSVAKSSGTGIFGSCLDGVLSERDATRYQWYVTRFSSAPLRPHSCILIATTPNKSELQSIAHKITYPKGLRIRGGKNPPELRNKKRKKSTLRTLPQNIKADLILNVIFSWQCKDKPSYQYPSRRTGLGRRGERYQRDRALGMSVGVSRW